MFTVLLNGNVWVESGLYPERTEPVGYRNRTRTLRQLIGLRSHCDRDAFSRHRRIGMVNR